MKTILVTGASSGLGFSCAKHLAAIGYRVYGSSRQATFPDQPTEGSVTMIPLDVRDSDSIDKALAFILNAESCLDVLINNAGYGIAGALEDTTAEEAQALFDTNFFGVHRVCTSVIPLMRERSDGLIINIGSLGGEVAIPFQTFYSASKAALALYSQGLGIELAPFNISVTHISPGDFKTGFTSARQFVAGDNNTSIHHDRCRRAVAVMEKDEQNGAQPKVLAKLIEQVIAGRARRSHYRTGLATQTLLIRLMAFLPNSTINRLIANIYGGRE